MKRLTVIQHNSAEYLGLLEDHLEGRRIRFDYVRPFVEGTPVPDYDLVGDGLILLGGGPWGSAGARNVPTLKQEIALATGCLMAGVPIIGFGLGAQILALAAGGGVIERDLYSSVGVAKRVADGALNGFLPETYPIIRYGRDRAIMPSYAKELAVDEAGETVLFQIGENCFGFDGHPGIKPAMVEDLVMEFEEAPDNSGETLDAMRFKVKEVEDSLIPIMTGLVQMTGIME
jgi:GMP synthase-like glutamine amidotransferase